MPLSAAPPHRDEPHETGGTPPAKAAEPVASARDGSGYLDPIALEKLQEAIGGETADAAKRTEQIKHEYQHTEAVSKDLLDSCYLWPATNS